MTLPAAASDLADLRWRHRLVVVTTTEGAAAQSAEQARDTAGWSQRQLVLVDLTGGTATVDGEAADLNAAAARATLRLDDRAPVVLVGLDGSVKQRRVDAFTNAELFAAVHVMPMRRGS